MNIVKKKINEIKMYDNNPRHNDNAIGYVANSISEFGFKVPIVLDKDNVIVCGHTRYLAAKQLKLKTVPCVIADDLNEEQIKAFRLVDNKTQELAEWDWNTIFDELDLIEGIDMNKMGFEDFLDEDKGELSWGGRATVPAFEIAESVVAHFPDVEFRVFYFCDCGDLEYGYSDKGAIKWLALSDDVYEMFDWGIDVDPYEGPTKEHYEQLRQYRRERVQEMIDLGVNISPDTWPPLPEHYDEERRLTRLKNGDDKGNIESGIHLDVDLDLDLPF